MTIAAARRSYGSRREDGPGEAIGLAGVLSPAIRPYPMNMPPLTASTWPVT